MRPTTTVYILRSESQRDRWYTGLTSNVGARLAAHNRGDSRHTSSGCPWRLEVVIEFAAVDAAKAFEAYLKSGSGRAFARRHFRAARCAAGPAEDGGDATRFVTKRCGGSARGG